MLVTEAPVYPTQPRPLRETISSLLRTAEPEPFAGTVSALIVPDTNLICGGQISADLYKLVKTQDFEHVILIAPSHMGVFNRLSICSAQTYHTPLGEIAINDALRNELCDEDDDIYLDDTGHYYTKGIDVQLPFLQTIKANFDIVPIVMGDETPEICYELGQAIGEIIYGRKTLLVASADVLSAPPEIMETFKHAFEALDVDQLMTLFNKQHLLAQGSGAVLVAVIAALHRHANHARLLHANVPKNDRPGFIGGLIGTA